MSRYNTDIVLICADEDRGDYKDGRPYSKILGSIHEDLLHRNLKITQIAHLGSILIGRNAWGKPLSITNTILFSELIDNKLKADNSILIKAYKAIYLILKPKAVIAIGLPFTLCIALRELKIPVIEVLHGIGYFDFDNFKDLYDRNNINEMPTHILSLDKISTETLQPLRNRGVEIVEIPHPWYKRFIDNELNIHSSISLSDENSLSFVPKDMKVVIVTLSWGYDGESERFNGIIENGIIPIELIDVIKHTKNEIFYCIRRHPVQQRNRKYDYQKNLLNNLILENVNCEWEISSRISLIKLFERCDAHVTMSSMTSYDAALFGIQTLFLCPSLHSFYKEFYKDLIENGYANKDVKSREEIKSWILNAKKIKPYSITDKNEDDWNEIIDTILLKKSDKTNQHI